MKRLLPVLLCLLVFVGCGANKSVPIKDGCFDITVAELVERVDKLSEGRGVPKLSEVVSTSIPNFEASEILSGKRDGIGAKSHQTGEDTRIDVFYSRESETVSEIQLICNVSGSQGDSALQMGQYLAAVSKTLSPDAKMDFDIGAVMASEKPAVYTEDNFKIYINPANPILLIKIVPNE